MCCRVLNGGADMVPLACHLAAHDQVHQGYGARVKAVWGQTGEGKLPGRDSPRGISRGNTLLAAQSRQLAVPFAQIGFIRRIPCEHGFQAIQICLNIRQVVAPLIDPDAGKQQLGMTFDGCRRELLQPAIEMAPFKVIQELIAVALKESHCAYDFAAG